MEFTGCSFFRLGSEWQSLQSNLWLIHFQSVVEQWLLGVQEAIMPPPEFFLGNAFIVTSAIFSLNKHHATTNAH